MTLPELDHFIYVFFTNPQEVTSQRIQYFCRNREYIKCLGLLADTVEERTGSIFHTLIFQLVILALSFWVVTSSGNLLGKGLVLSLFLHLLVDQAIDYQKGGNLSRWFQDIPINLDKNQSLVFLLVASLIFIVLGVAA